MSKLVTGVVRLSYVHLLEKWSNSPDQEPKYSCQILIDKNDTATLKAIKAAQEQAIEQGKQKFGAGWAKKLASIIHDGDADDEDREELKGHYYMSVSSKKRVPVLNRQNELIDSEDEIYSGMYARVSLGSYPYSVSGNRGTSFGLNAVLKWKDGDRLGGSVDPFAEFADILEADNESSDEADLGIL